MRRTIASFFGLIFLLMLSSCLTSIHPLYTESTKTVLPRLEGTWISGNEKLTFRKKRDQKSYTFTHERDSLRAVYEVNLIRLGERIYADFFIEENPYEENDLIALSFITVHIFRHIEINNDTLSIRDFDVEHIQELILDRKVKIDHEVQMKDDSETIILTAQPDEIQQFLTIYGNDPDIYYNSDNYYRQR